MCAREDIHRDTRKFLQCVHYATSAALLQEKAEKPRLFKSHD